MEERILVHNIATAAEQYGFEKGIAIGRRKGLRDNERVQESERDLEKAIQAWNEAKQNEKEI